MSVRRILSDVIAAWKQFGVPKDLVMRDIEIPLDVRDIVVITGVRRSGKTYMLFHLIKKLLDAGVSDNNIFYINFEDERILPRTEFLSELIPTILENYAPSKMYLFLDEIHRIPGWDLWLHRQHARGIRLYVTGSTLELQPDRIPRALRGRTLTYTIYPLSFREFLRFKGVALGTIMSDEERALVRNYLNEYLLFGGFPEIVKMGMEDIKIRKLHEYFRAIMYRDILEAHDIRNITLLEIMMKLLMNSSFFGTRKLYNTLKSMGIKTSTRTILEYKKAIENSYMLLQVEIFSYKVKDQLQYPKKIYCIDHGLRRAISIAYSESIGRTLENAVFVELLRQKKPTMTIHYWKSREGYEVDFIINENYKPKSIIQVAYEIHERTQKREERALMKALKELNLKRGVLLANVDYEEVKRINGKEIRYIPIWKFFLQPNKFLS